MGKYYTQLTPSLIEWIKEQHCFWVATAPLSPRGHVNVSPKGMQDGRIFHVVDERSVYYLDTSGSGNETISHLYEPLNGRLTICFIAFTGPPRILRLWGRGRVLERGTPAYNTLIPPNSSYETSLNLPGLRAIIHLDIEQVGTSCGFSVPFYDFKGYRRELEEFAERKVKLYEKTAVDRDGYEWYWAWKNAWSVDGLPGLKRAGMYAREKRVEPLEKFVGVEQVYKVGKDGVAELGMRVKEQPRWVVFVWGVVVGLVLALLMQRGQEYFALVRQMIAI